MKTWVLYSLCTIVLGLASAGLASASPAPSAADQQFLASLAQPAPAPVASPAPLPWEESVPDHGGSGVVGGPPRPVDFLHPLLLG